MGFVGLASCLALAAVLVVSGVAKLLDRAGTREAVVGFGVPAALVGPVALLLAPAELVTAVLLLVTPAQVAGLVLAAVLLLGFTTAVVVALRTGRRPDCRCFGRLGGADLSDRTVVRNLGLLVLAAAGLGGTLAGDRPDGGALAGAVLLGLGTAAGVVALEAEAGRRARAARTAADEAVLAEGADRRLIAPFVLPTPDGRTVDSRSLLAPGLPLLLVSLSPGCGPCEALRPDVAGWAAALRDRLAVAVLASGRADTNSAPYERWRGELLVLVDEDGAVRASLGTTATPSAVVLDASGRTATGVASGEVLVRRLVAEVLAGSRIVWQGLPDGESPAADLDLDSAPVLRSGVVARELGDSTLLLDETTGASVLLDARGALVASLLDEELSLRHLAEEVARSYAAPVEVVAPDVLAVARALGESGLLAGVAPGTADPAETAGHPTGGETPVGA